MNDETRTPNRWPTILALLVIGPVGFLFGHGCGSVTNDRDAAINNAAADACGRYQSCGDIGPSGTYPSITDCQTDWKAKFTMQWPPECQGRIDQAMLNVCRAAITSTSCTSVLDFLNTLYVKCAASSVCDLPSDAGRG